MYQNGELRSKKELSPVSKEELAALSNRTTVVSTLSIEDPSHEAISVDKTRMTPSSADEMDALVAASRDITSRGSSSIAASS